MSPAERSDARREMAATLIGILGLLAFVLLASAGCDGDGKSTTGGAVFVCCCAVVAGLLLAWRLVRDSDDSPWDDDDEAGA